MELNTPPGILLVDDDRTIRNIYPKYYEWADTRYGPPVTDLEAIGLFEQELDSI